MQRASETAVWAPQTVKRKRNRTWKIIFKRSWAVRCARRSLCCSETDWRNWLELVVGACTYLDSSHYRNHRLHSNQITQEVDMGLASLPALSFYIHAAHREVKTLVPCKFHFGKGTHWQFRRRRNTFVSARISCVKLSVKTKTPILFFGMAHGRRLNAQNSNDILTNLTLYERSLCNLTVNQTMVY